MRDLTSDFGNEIDKRGGIHAHAFFRFVAKNRDTNEDEVLCLWTGDDHQSFTIEGNSDVYYGAGSILGIDEIKNEVGTTVRKFGITVSHLTTEVQLLLRQYEAKFAKVSVYTILFSTDTGLPISTALRRFKGWVDKAPIKKGNLNSEGSARIEMVSISRNLTRPIPSRRSDTNQKLRDSSDEFFQYVSVSGYTLTPWASESIDTKVSGSGRNNRRGKKLYGG